MTLMSEIRWPAKLSFLNLPAIGCAKERLRAQINELQKRLRNAISPSCRENDLIYFVSMFKAVEVLTMPRMGNERQAELYFLYLSIHYSFQIIFSIF